MAICIGRYRVGILYILVDRDNLSHVAECSDCSNKCDAHDAYSSCVGITIEISAAL